MSAVVIDGKAVAERRREALRQRVGELKADGCHPCLAAITVVPDPGWQVYSRGQAKSCAAVGIDYRAESLPTGADQQDLIERIETLNADPSVHGVIIQAPLPKPFDLFQAQGLLGPAKDVEGVNPANLGLVLAGRSGIAPCTARSAIALAEHHLGDLRGVEAVVVGASVIVGKPVAQLLLTAGATPRVCHIDTKDVAEHCRQADLVIVAVGRAGLLTAAMVKPGATIIDVGINRVPGPDGKRRIVGDVADDVWGVAGAVSPVPGGVGSLTTVILLEHTVQAAESLAREQPAIGGSALARILGPIASELNADVTDKLARMLSRHLVTGSLAESRSDLERRLGRGLVMMDGAMGTELMARGIAANRVCFANRERPDDVVAVHRSYIDAGAEVLLTNTFTLNRWTCPDRQELVAHCAAGVRLARQAGGQALVLGSIGPLPGIVGADLSEAEAKDAFAEIALVMADAGVDGFCCETLPSTRHAEAALAGVRRASTLPTVVSRSYGQADATELRAFAQCMAAGGATAVGINCIGGPSALVPIVQQLAVVSPLPVMARPNAGYPRLVDGRPVYDLRPAWMAKQAKLYCDAGVRMIGGCCGIGPAHIAAVAQALEDHAPATVELPPDDATQTILPGRPAAGLGHCEVIALLPGGLEPTDVIRAGKALVGAGINCLGLDGGWPGSPDPCGMPSRIRHLQDVSGAQGVLCLTAGAVDLRSAQQACQAADLLGIDRVLIDDGIFGGGGPAAGRATTEQLVRLIADLNAGYDAAGNRISCAGAFTIGVRLPVERIGRAHQLADAGAHFATIQPVYDPKDFREAMHAYDAKLPLLAEVLVLTDADTAEALDNEVPALQVPDNLVERLRFDPDEDIHGVLRFLGHWRDRLAGVCLVLPDARTEAAVAVANGLPRPA